MLKKTGAFDHVVWNSEVSMQPGCWMALTCMGQSSSVPADTSSTFMDAGCALAWMGGGAGA